jgi:hypothetical protein
VATVVSKGAISGHWSNESAGVALTARACAIIESCMLP